MTSPTIRSRPACRWVEFDPPDPAIVSRLVQELRLPPIVCSLLAVRGRSDTEVVKAYLRPRLEHLYPASLMEGIGLAVARG
jgi:hypothetical protein